MGPIIRMIQGLFKDMNHVYMVEIIVIFSIAIFVLYVFHSLGLLKKAK